MEITKQSIYGYIRVSSSGQAGEDKTSLDEQRRKIIGTAMMIGDEPARIFCDAGVSGSVKVADRPEGGQLYEALLYGDTLIVAKLDRLFRSAADADTTIKYLSARGVDLISLDMGTDPVGKSAISQLMVNMIAVFAEFERSLINERTSDGKKAKKAKGGHTAGSPPRGFDVVDGNLVPNDEFPHMLATWRLWKSGVTVGQALNMMDDLGILSRTGKRLQHHQAKRSLEFFDSVSDQFVNQ